MKLSLGVFFALMMMMMKVLSTSAQADESFTLECQPVALEKSTGVGI